MRGTASCKYKIAALKPSPGFQRAVVLQLGCSEQKDLLGWINQPVFFQARVYGEEGGLRASQSTSSC